MPRAHQARASSENGPSGRSARHASRTASLLLRGQRAQVLAGRPDAERERLPEVVEVRVVGAGDEGAADHVGHPRALEAVRDVALEGAGHELLALDARVHAARRGPVRAQHRHATAGDVPHARGDRAARPRHARHLPHALIRVAHEADHQRRQRCVELAVAPRQRLGDALADVGAGIALPAGGDELRRRVDRRDVLGADAGDELARETARSAADVEHPALGQAREVGERRGQRRHVPAHEPVVLVSRSAELHSESSSS